MTYGVWNLGACSVVGWWMSAEGKSYAHLRYSLIINTGPLQPSNSILILPSFSFINAKGLVSIA